MDEIDQMAQVAAEPVELPRHQRIALSQRLEACFQTRPIVALARMPGPRRGVPVRRRRRATHRAADQVSDCPRPWRGAYSRSTRAAPQTCECEYVTKQARRS